MFCNWVPKVYGDVGIDMLAGPSEVAVVVDETTDVAGAARELIAQTEHDPMNAALLVASSAGLISRINDEIELQLSTLPRADIVRASLSEQSVAVVCDDRALMVAVGLCEVPNERVCRSVAFAAVNGILGCGYGRQ